MAVMGRVPNLVPRRRPEAVSRRLKSALPVSPGSSRREPRAVVRCPLCLWLDHQRLPEGGDGVRLPESAPWQSRAPEPWWRSLTCQAPPSA